LNGLSQIQNEVVLNWMFDPQGGVRNSNAPKWLTPQSLFLTKFLWNGPLSHQVHNDRRRLSTASEVPKTIEWWNVTNGDF
jgi:hypothetical protein